MQTVMKFLFIFYLFFSFPILSQASKLDSLKQELSLSQQDTNAIKIIEVIVKSSTDLDSISFYAGRGMELARKIDSIQGFAYLSNLLIRQLFRRQKFEQAIEVAHEVLDYALAYPDTLNIARSYYNLGLFNKSLNKYDVAIDNYQLSIDNYQAIKDTARLTQVLSGIGIVYSIIEENGKAMNAYREGLRIAEKIKNWEDCALICNGIGILFYHQKQYKLAEPYHIEAYEHAKKINDIEYMLNALNNLGAVYIAEKEYDKAIEIHQNALNLSKKHNDKSSTAAAYDNLGTAYKKIGDKKQAKIHYEQSLKIRRTLRSRRKLLGSLNNTGRFYYEIGALETSKKLFEEALTLVRTLKEKEISWSIYKGYSTLLWKMGDYKGAKIYMDSTFHAREASFSKEQISAVNLAEQRYKAEKRQDSIKNLTQHNKLINKNLQKQRTISSLSFTLLVISFGVVGLLFYLFRLKRTQNQQLESNNQNLLNLNGVLANELTEKENELLTPEYLAKKTITLSSNSKEMLKLEEILYFKAEGNGVQIITNTKKHWEWVNLGSYEKILPKKLFIKAHRSYLVNILHIKKRKTRSLQMVDNQIINIGNTLRIQVNETLDKIAIN